MPTTDATVQAEILSFFTHHRLEVDANVGIAFSGGSDSLALLLAAAKIFAPAHLSVFYVNHQLRSRSELANELTLNMQNCRSLGLELIVLDLGADRVRQEARLRNAGLEDAARHLRYATLLGACQKRGCRYLLTAHNADDQLETLLMRLFQSASIASLQGIQSVRSQDESDVQILRPLLNISHATLQQSVKEQGFSWSEDSTNEEDAYLRNAVRHQVIPSLLTVFPHAYDATARMQTRFAEAGSFLDDEVDRLSAQVEFGRGSARFPLAWYQKLAPILREMVLFRIARVLHDTAAGAAVVRIRTALEGSGVGARWELQFAQSVVSLSQGMVVWESSLPDWQFCLPILDPAAEQVLDLGSGMIVSIRKEDPSADKDLLRLDASMLKNPVLRSVQPGDKISLESGTVLVTKLLASYKLPRHQYFQVPVLVDQSGVVAVFALCHGGRDRLAKRFKAPLARRLTNIYSSSKRNDDSEIEK
ncbi:MAG: tRNA lysidine(34) synthetase TilS [Sphaerochaeta sp.]|uniref:tRNA lysidine(34) synthetase TilS n=1 Tax=Sphaerochaeta sp. TaxID=1972642 RepID=UPI002FCA986C